MKKYRVVVTDNETGEQFVDETDTFFFAWIEHSGEDYTSISTEMFGFDRLDFIAICAALEDYIDE